VAPAQFRWLINLLRWPQGEASLRHWIRLALVLVTACGGLSACARGKHHPPPGEADYRSEMSDRDRRFSIFTPSYKRAVADAHRKYRESLDHAPVREVGLPRRHAEDRRYDERRYVDGEPRVRRYPSRRRAGRSAGRRERPAAGFRMSPTTPYVGSPEHVREQEYERRRERELGRRMRICGNC
jgi:hypothetical protein